MKKIMFNDRYGLTKAVLEGRIPKDFFSLTWDEKNGTLWYENSMGDFIDVRNSKYALCKVGEVVAVAQRYRDCGGLNGGVPRWEAIAEAVGADSKGWDNKMFVRADLMPHHIRITDVRVEHLQDISDEDCLKEGIDKMLTGCEYYQYSFYDNDKGSWNNYKSPREAFAHLIDKVSGKGTWESNPYVFVYDFELVK